MENSIDRETKRDVTEEITKDFASFCFAERKKKKKEALARIYIYIHTNDWISHFIVNNRNG